MEEAWSGVTQQGKTIAVGGSARPPYGMHRVVEPVGVLPQAAARLDPSLGLARDEARVRLEALHIDAASLRQLLDVHGGEGDLVRQAVLDIVGARGKLQNPVTGSGGTFVGVVEAKGPGSPLAAQAGDRVVSLVSLTAVPLSIEDGLGRWDGRSAQVPVDGYAIVAGSSPMALVPDDLDTSLALAVLDVCGAPALTARVVQDRKERDRAPTVCVIGASGKSGSLSAVAARRSGACRVVGVVPDDGEATRARSLEVFDAVVVADARRPTEVHEALGEQFRVTVVCVDAPGCEHGAILATAPGGTIIFFSMATSFASAALGAESIGADVTMLIGNGFVPGHAASALELIREERQLRGLFAERTGHPTRKVRA